MTRFLVLLVGVAFVAVATGSQDVKPRSVSGIYPHLAMFNEESECGTGAVVPWADRLWVITYAPHRPQGSTDKLYEITPELQQIVRSESVGGTHANRMIHRESNQLFVGPYVVDERRKVRVIPPAQMFGRLTGNARHLTEPVHMVYFATMEEGLYEVDVNSLAVTELWADEQLKEGRHADLPGYHGKGLYSGQGRIVYANNGDHAPKARSDPRTPSGALAEWDGQASAWKLIRRNQFTEVTGPGGIYGNENPGSDPIWSIGWDHRSLLLMLLDQGRWHTFRLPKASHSYDGAHGWNTEWPRIRDVGERDLLMTMHGMFWNFPRTFSASNTAGLRPRSAYLKVIGDFCRWNDRLVFGCDDSARSEFLNKRNVKGGIPGPGQSQSSLLFAKLNMPDRLGPALANGALWLRDAVEPGDVSDPFLFSGWQRRSAHFVNEGPSAASFIVEVDALGDGRWRELQTVNVAPGQSEWIAFASDARGEWVRVRSVSNCASATVHFTLSSPDARPARPDRIFDGLARIGARGEQLGGIVRAAGNNKRTLQLAAMSMTGDFIADAGYYELDASLQLKHIDDSVSQAWVKSRVAIPTNVITVDAASVLVVDDRGRRWRLPKTDTAFDAPTRAGQLRICREVATERDLFSAHGTFYELPAENAEGFAKIRPVSTHRLRIMDYCSYRGLLILTGVRSNAPPGEHILRSDDGRAAVWAGVVEDLWKLGKPAGTGGPWLESPVKAGVPSDAYLLWGYDERELTLRADGPVAICVEVDLTGEGHWVAHRNFLLQPGRPAKYHFPDAFQARWVRFVADRDCIATAQLEYH